MLAAGLPGCPQATRNVLGVGTRGLIAWQQGGVGGACMGGAQTGGWAKNCRLSASLSNYFSGASVCLSGKGKPSTLPHAKGVENLNIVEPITRGLGGPRAGEARGPRPSSLHWGKGGAPSYRQDGAGEKEPKAKKDRGRGRDRQPGG